MRCASPECVTRGSRLLAASYALSLTWVMKARHASRETTCAPPSRRLLSRTATAFGSFSGATSTHCSPCGWLWLLVRQAACTRCSMAPLRFKFVQMRLCR